MIWGSIFYLATTFILFGIFVAIVVYTYSRKNRKRLEDPKYRMLDDEDKQE
ncbi:cbb3-type cytochrome c oxidase subunit 3 [Desulfurispirillum indicum]|uniref:Cbb3-type cytochrome oxidase component n=1 Tax=Desulfurispirillum indicum (strain ATCC BAA-1389 / DSM 22839 / S5) TaxID=653733 RepID=E6W3A9_DESIS|nr:cbb3-type cytochrome c oxidase subunit 3 [Desulfurispirillum indicum]ADU66863.1 hypothetical protein Selin_2143 [Desulfurispirillum indicum S5]UCZ56181.1 cbb3-type cytochrome c oxidase subunit 3 [Desulfurispirillum indicum]